MQQQICDCCCYRLLLQNTRNIALFVEFATGTATVGPGAIGVGQGAILQRFWSDFAMARRNARWRHMHMLRYALSAFLQDFCNF